MKSLHRSLGLVSLVFVLTLSAGVWAAPQGKGLIGEWDMKLNFDGQQFPNPDKSVGEWIQIRDREGRPESKVVALPVKDPFHIVRALALAVPVLERLADKRG